MTINKKFLKDIISFNELKERTKTPNGNPKWDEKEVPNLDDYYFLTSDSNLQDFSIQYMSENSSFSFHNFTDTFNECFMAIGIKLDSFVLILIEELTSRICSTLFSPIGKFNLLKITKPEVKIEISRDDVKEIVKKKEEIIKRDKEIENLWKEFNSLSLTEDKRLNENWKDFEKGTHIGTIYSYFDKKYSKDISHLIDKFGDKNDDNSNEESVENEEIENEEIDRKKDAEPKDDKGKEKKKEGESDKPIKEEKEETKTQKEKEEMTDDDMERELLKEIDRVTKEDKKKDEEPHLIDSSNYTDYSDYESNKEKESDSEENYINEEKILNASIINKKKLKSGKIFSKTFHPDDEELE